MRCSVLCGVGLSAFGKKAAEQKEERILEMEHINFDRSDTKAIKGAAVLLMLFHHLTGFPYRFPVGFGGFSTLIPAGYLEAFGTAAKICVPMFFFLGGYGLYCKWKSIIFNNLL